MNSRLILATLAVAVSLSACGKKEEEKPVIVIQPEQQAPIIIPQAPAPAPIVTPAPDTTVVTPPTTVPEGDDMTKPTEKK